MPSAEPSEDPYSRLSPRERELLRCLGRGVTSDDIARQAGISTEVVISDFESIRQKLGLASRHELRAYVLKRLVSGRQAVVSEGPTGQLPLPFGSDGV
jgi:DNA-binding CsgD family transcriptional regulator